MRLYPPFKKTKVKIENPSEFYGYLKSNIGMRETTHNGSLIGEINEDGFKVERKFSHFNGGRTIIRGQFEKGKENYLTIYLECRNGPIIFITLVLMYILIMGIVKKSIYSIHIMISVSIFFYFGFWILYLVDLKKTKIEMYKIIKKANGTI